MFGKSLLMVLPFNGFLKASCVWHFYGWQSRSAWENLIPALHVTEEEVAESRLKAQRSAPYRKPGEKNIGQIIGLL